MNGQRARGRLALVREVSRRLEVLFIALLLRLRVPCVGMFRGFLAGVVVFARLRWGVRHGQTQTAEHVPKGLHQLQSSARHIRRQNVAIMREMEWRKRWCVPIARPSDPLRETERAPAGAPSSLMAACPGWNHPNVVGCTPVPRPRDTRDESGARSPVAC